VLFIFKLERMTKTSFQKVWYSKYFLKITKIEVLLFCVDIIVYLSLLEQVEIVSIQFGAKW